MLTPWGNSDRCDKVADGVYSVGTPSHGGYLIGTKVAQRYLSQAALQFVGKKWCNWYAFEEDCAWAVIGLEHPELFTLEDKERNRWYFYEGGLLEVLRRYYPRYLDAEYPIPA